MFGGGGVVLVMEVEKLELIHITYNCYGTKLDIHISRDIIVTLTRKCTHTCIHACIHML